LPIREQLRVLKENGHRLWLDDFGSGYSSLSMFSRYPFDLVKFDMDLLRRLDENNGANRIILRAMIGAAREMGVHTLAEGMETEEQRQFLLECGCELAQGVSVPQAGGAGRDALPAEKRPDGQALRNAGRAGPVYPEMD
jgi:EAL domain-containing protein (putative c-di-GMP-specific phosphodiesterase class I)